MDQIWKWWQKLPKWLRDTIQVVMAMTILLIIYDLVAPLMTHKPYSMNMVISFPFQVILGFIVVAVYNYLKSRSQAKEKAAKEHAAEVERLKQEEQTRQHSENLKRNQANAAKQQDR
ncbi:hypothetical protein AYR62_09365 [Secundilactobacillus paracollinoides]|uniref:Uncharacterized protein n=1 Tax=Secundilactobacillus paracollinoides TaxID=240427 RepID=A0A1B2IYW5_9LACO|nr:hypothetical protein [Secundilactobacillus paracollinoides]ANZ61345.1 hypothetical protein AYR61_08260 [Secundilactobacillus paracollinoides]ANZ64264.1 hypothetical protein AYR62_09365 [Secundilactobacillus paracollinoides]ANZ67266.1 hypothetical protein AYR63_09010 [Secundilactobacillus paracollinoides]KRL75396.1 hypothetical protein FC17_GL002717 [Secundilactobacillus paracollinoides DSM 15502 = JCM 11969]